jgi:L-serine dehydratase
VAIGVFDLFSIGIGPSARTVGPMRAAHGFVTGLATDGLLETVGASELSCSARWATGHGRGGEPAVLLGLAGESPRAVGLRR